MTDTSEQPCNRRLALLILASLAMFATAVVVRVGLGNTPYHTADSLGRTMGFNDPLYAEHYVIIVKNFRPASLFDGYHWYEWLLLAAHITGGFLLMRGSTTAALATRWFFATQWLVFPMGVLFVLTAPFMMYGILTGQRMDRESFVDIPFVMLVGQGGWIWIATFIAFAMKGPRLGLRNLCRAAKNAAGIAVKSRSTTMFLALSFSMAVASDAYAAQPKVQAEIDYLLSRVASFDGKFLRAGTEYTAREAADHLRSKLGKAGGRVKTAEDFIAGIASKSYLSGEPYQMKSPDGSIQPAGPWLTRELEQYRKAIRRME